MDGPVIVCLQAGNVNTGAFDPFEELIPIAHERGAWVHIDGAFGIWAAAVPSLQHLMAGSAAADSWSTDAHKWLNVPYDSGLVFVRDAAAHHGAMTLGAAYYIETEGGERDNYNWTPESSRRARGFSVLAALRSLGRSGLVDLIERDCAHARRMAERLSAGPGVRILNEVVLNQTLVRFEADGDDPDGTAGDRRTRAVIDAVQRDGTCWLSGTTWAGRAAMRVSVTSWRTTEDDIERSAAAILACLATVDEAGQRGRRDSRRPRPTGIGRGLLVAKPARPGRASARRSGQRLGRHPRVQVGREPRRDGEHAVDPDAASQRADGLAVPDVDADVGAAAPDHQVTDLRVGSARQAAGLEVEVERARRSEPRVADDRCVTGPA